MAARTRVAAAAAVALSLACYSATPSSGEVLTAAAVAGGNSIAQLAGYWTGEANVILASGPDRRFKCVVTYRAAGDGSQVRQTLRCKNSDIRLEAATVLQVNGTEVTGQWEDRINDLGGAVNGVVTPGGFDVHLGGRFFQAKLQVEGSGCEQNVRLTPARADVIKELSARLKRC